LYESGLRKFLTSLAEVHPSIDASIRTLYAPPPSHLVAAELDDLNTRYMSLVAASQDRLRFLLEAVQLQDPVAAARWVS
jgi:hypothetical protein